MKLVLEIKQLSHSLEYEFRVAEFLPTLKDHHLDFFVIGDDHILGYVFVRGTMAIAGVYPKMNKMYLIQGDVTYHCFDNIAERDEFFRKLKKTLKALNGEESRFKDES